MNDVDINILNSFVNPLRLGRNMRSLADLARLRITAWMAANPKITQATIATAIGVSQSWVSLYKSGGVEADIDQLDAMARVFGHTLMELFDLRPDPKEAALIEAFRALEPSRRDFAVEVIRQLVPKRARSR